MSSVVLKQMGVRDGDAAGQYTFYSASVGSCEDTRGEVCSVQPVVNPRNVVLLADSTLVPGIVTSNQLVFPHHAIRWLTSSMSSAFKQMNES